MCFLFLAREPSPDTDTDTDTDTVKGNTEYQTCTSWVRKLV